MESQIEALLDSLVESYRAALSAFGEHGSRALPQVGGALKERLFHLRDQIADRATPSSVVDVRREVEAELKRWSQTSCAHLDKTTREVQDIMKIVASTAQAVGERDQRYSSQFQQISARLQSAAALNDLSRIRDTLAESIRHVNTSAREMVTEGEQSLGLLRAQISIYQTRLAEAESLAHRDTLTGLVNRRGVEQQLERRVADARPFTVIMIDLDGFKPINDRFGHLAGDSILKQFSKDLRPLFRVTDTVARWGGDEFLIVCDCDAKAAGDYLSRIRQWVFGVYTIESSIGKQKVTVGGSIGVAPWKPGETAAAVVARADFDMYQEKTLAAKRRA